MSGVQNENWNTERAKRETGRKIKQEEKFVCGNEDAAENMQKCDGKINEE